jgi:hypothetical protein
MFYCFYVEYIYFCTKFNVKQKNLFIYGKVGKELKWASVLQIAQSSHLDIAMACISNVLAEINSDLAAAEKGSDEYFRLTHLAMLFGGCYYAMRGADGIVTGMVVDMLDGVKG